MSATSRLKQLLFIVAALALVSLGLVAALSTASPARADEPCVETQDSYGPWVNEGDQIRTEENNAPGADGDLVRYVFVGETAPEVITPGVAGGHYSWNGGNRGVGDPPTVTPPHDDWQLNTDGEPAGHLTAAAWSGTPGVGLHVLGNSPSNASWFYTVASVPAVTDTDFLWQKQTRTFTEGVDCPDPGPETCPEGTDNAGQEIPAGQTEEEFCDDEVDPGPETCPEGTDKAGQEIPQGQTEEEFCDEPVVDDGKKIVVCKYVGTPPGVLDHIVIVSENTLNNLVDVNGNPFTGQFPFSWTDAQGQTTQGSVATRYAEEGEQANELDLVEECGGEEEPDVCPEGTDNAGETIPEGETEESFCDDEVDPGPETCPEGTDKAGQEIPQGQTEEEFCDEEDPEVCPEGTDHAGEEIPADKDAEEFCDDDDEEDVCPDGSDHAGEEVPEGHTEEEFCDDDDVDPGPDCTEDPTQKKCDEDNPPVVVPDDGNSPSNGPTVRGASATAPTAAAGTTVVGGTPAAQVPTAVNAGLAPQELAGDGGTMGLLGIAAALLGAALVGLTFRPKRRIGAASHART